MFYLEKEVRISSAHHLNNYEGPCANKHGHNWVIKAYCQCEDKQLSDIGMIVDFRKIKEEVMKLDHADLNKIFEKYNPTAENIAKYLCYSIPCCYQVDVQETEGAIVTYVKD